jgi:hypothetical protein
MCVITPRKEGFVSFGGIEIFRLPVIEREGLIAFSCDDGWQCTSGIFFHCITIKIDMLISSLYILGTPNMPKNAKLFREA